MARPRKTLSELGASGYLDRLSATEVAERRAAENSTPDRSVEIQKLDELIADALQACGEGHTVGPLFKKNPAFGNLEALVRTRAQLLKSHKPAPKSGEQLLAESQEFLRQAGITN